MLQDLMTEASFMKILFYSSTSNLELPASPVIEKDLLHRHI